MWWVVGCNHGIQTQAAECDSAQVVEQKQHFTCLLKQMMIDEKIEFIGEEWGHQMQTIAHHLAQQRNIEWANINTSCDDLQRLEIPCDYLHGHYTNADKARWNQQRENFMVEQVSARRAASITGLVICGFDHLIQISERLNPDSAGQSRVDYRTTSWYRPTFTDDTGVGGTNSFF